MGSIGQIKGSVNKSHAGQEALKYTTRQNFEKLKNHAKEPEAGKEYLVYRAEENKNSLRVHKPFEAIVINKTKNFAEWVDKGGKKGRCFLKAKDKIILFVPKGGSKA